MNRRIGIGSMLIASVLGSGFFLGGCVPSGSSSDAEHIRDLILTDGGGVEDVLVNFYTDIFVKNVFVAISMPRVNEDSVVEITSAVDAALEIAWKEAPFEASNITISVRLDQFDGNATANDPGGISMDMREVARSLNVRGYIGTEDLTVSSSFLSGAYGPRS